MKSEYHPKGRVCGMFTIDGEQVVSMDIKDLQRKIL